MEFCLRHKWMTICSLGMFWLFSVTLSPASEPLEIRVKEQVTLQGDTVYLENIASFHPATDDRIERLGKIVVASAPAPGNAVQLNKRFLNYKIGSVFENNHEDIKLTLPANLEVKRDAQVVTESQMEKIFKDHISQHAPWPAAEITFEKILTPPAIALPVGKLSWNVEEKGNQNYVGNVPLLVHFQVDGKESRKASLSGRISLAQEVVKASRRIKKGQVLSEDDLTTVKENNVHVKQGAISNPADAVGKKSVQNIQAGQVLTALMIEDPPLVKKGNRVIIQAENKSLMITAAGKVLEDGRLGDQVRVVNVGSRKEIVATVKAQGIVEVHF